MINRRINLVSVIRKYNDKPNGLNNIMLYYSTDNIKIIKRILELGMIPCNVPNDNVFFTINNPAKNDPTRYTIGFKFSPKTLVSYNYYGHPVVYVQITEGISLKHMRYCSVLTVELLFKMLKNGEVRKDDESFQALELACKNTSSSSMPPLNNNNLEIYIDRDSSFFPSYKPCSNISNASNQPHSTQKSNSKPSEIIILNHPHGMQPSCDSSFFPSYKPCSNNNAVTNQPHIAKKSNSLNENNKPFSKIVKNDNLKSPHGMPPLNNNNFAIYNNYNCDSSFFPSYKPCSNNNAVTNQLHSTQNSNSKPSKIIILNHPHGMQPSCDSSFFPSYKTTFADTVKNNPVKGNSSMQQL